MSAASTAKAASGQSVFDVTGKLATALLLVPGHPTLGRPRFVGVRVVIHGSELGVTR